MKIEKGKYQIRPWKIEDVKSLAENANNINIWNNIRDRFPYPYTEEDGEEFINSTIQKDEPEDFAIIIDRKAVGGIGFVPQTDVERISAEIGYWLGEDYWGKGIMSSVVRDISDYIFNNTDIIRLFAPVFEFNHASMKVLEKSGFQKIAILHKAAIKNNKVIDMHYYELIKK